MGKNSLYGDPRYKCIPVKKKTQDLLFLPVNHVTDSWGGDLQQLLLLGFCLFPLIPHLGLFWVSVVYSLTSEQQIPLNHDLVEIKSIN